MSCFCTFTNKTVTLILKKKLMSLKQLMTGDCHFVFSGPQGQNYMITNIAIDCSALAEQPVKIKDPNVNVIQSTAGIVKLKCLESNQIYGISL